MMHDFIKQIKFWGKDISVKLVFEESGYSTNTQKEEAYQNFDNHINHYSDVSLAELKSYIHANAAEILAYTSLPAIPRDVFKIVSIEAIKFFSNNSIAVFCDTSWDSHGLALFFQNGQCEAITPDRVWFRT